MRTTILAVLAALGAAGASENFIIFMADDVGYSDLGSYGSPTIRTPTLDLMAQQGARFTQMYSAAPMCSPSRAAMLTGNLPVRTGVYTNESFPLDLLFRVFYPPSVGCPPQSVPMLQEILRQRGYFTSMLGKWHLGSNFKGNCTPAQRGFDYFYGLLYSHEEGYPGPTPENIVFPPMPLHENLKLIEQPLDLTTLTPRYTARALELLAQLAPNASVANKALNSLLYAPGASNWTGFAPAAMNLTTPPLRGQPFFLYFAFEESHVPLFTANNFRNVSRRDRYGDMTMQMDAAIAQVMTFLQQTGLDQTTTVLFSSDNGAWIDPGTGFPGSAGQPAIGGSNAPFKDGKGSTWEGGLREPAILWAPGRVPPGQVIQEPATLMDVFDTFLERANAQSPPASGLDSASFWRFVNGSSAESMRAQPTSFAYLASQALTPAPIPPLPSNPAFRQMDQPPLHDFIWMWREDTLYAARYGSYKAHFFTRSGFGSDPPVAQDPPLLFDLNWDFGEAFPLNVTVAPYDAILAAIVAGADAHRASVTMYPTQYEALDWSLVPCCNKPFNMTEALEFLEEGQIGLAIWDSCVCSGNTNIPTRRS